MHQPPLPTDPLSPLFSEDAEPDGSPTHAPTMTFYGTRQIFPPPQKLTSLTVRPAQPPAEPTCAVISTAPDSGSAAVSATPTSLDRFPITAAWLSGALVGVIAHSLAMGYVWKIGPLQEAGGPHVIWLRPGSPGKSQIAAWLVVPTATAP